MNRAVLSIFSVDPFRIGGNEVFARELSSQLAGHGWRSVLCFLRKPQGKVAEFLDLPNVTCEALPMPGVVARKPVLDLLALLRRHRPDIVHLHFLGFVGPTPWLAKLTGAGKVFFTDQGSRVAGRVIRRAPLWKRMAVRLINSPITGVVAVSDYGLRCLADQDLIPRSRFRRIYNSVDPAMCDNAGADGGAFRKRHGIPLDRKLVVQVSWIIPEKGIDDMLEAARLLLAEDRGVHFAFVGKGAHEEHCATLARKMGIEDRITWTGLVKNPLAEGVYAAADVVCQPSRWEEVFGWVIAEAIWLATDRFQISS